MGDFNLNKIKNYYTLILFLLSILLFPLAVGSVHLFDWDEVNFAEITREMILNNNFLNVQINFQPFWEKPPLFFWIQALSMKIFGINEFASRFPNVLIGIISILSLNYIGKKEISNQFGFIWALTYLGSLLPHFYFKSGIIDPLFNLFIFLSLYSFYVYQKNFKLKDIILTATFAAFAFLTKGPVAILIIGLVIFIFVIFNFSTFKFKFLQFILATLLCLAICSIWFIAEIINGGGLALFQEFIAYQIRLFTQSEAGHGQPFFYHFIVLFFGCFPISLIAFPYILKTTVFIDNKGNDKNLYFLNFILFWVVLILFSLTTTKIVHYSSLCYFPLSFIAAYVLYKNTKEDKVLHKTSFILLTIVGVLLSFIFIALPLIVKFKNEIIPFIKDPFAVQNILVPVQWNGFEFLIGVFYLIFFLYLMIRIKKNSQNIFYLFFMNAIMLNLLMLFIVPKVEQHVQGSLIAFFKQHQNPKEYVVTYGFKSYAQFFYSDKQKSKNVLSNNENWLFEGKIDQPVFIVCKTMNKEKVLQFKNIKLLYEKGGFVFFVRKKER
jgi:4-amino-4-deoxy-L-arabinose transferase-like glycosyltransferase